MYAATLLTALACVATTLAAPQSSPWQPAGGQCLTQSAVDTLVNGYTYLLEHPGGPEFNSTADSILSATNFVVYSDSINILSHRPLGQPAYPSRAVYIATQYQTPPLPIVQTLETFFNCNKIAWRWKASGIGSNADEILGIITMNVDVASTQIEQLYSEFNTAAFEVDLGYPECKQQ